VGCGGVVKVIIHIWRRGATQADREEVSPAFFSDRPNVLSENDGQVHAYRGGADGQ